MQHTIERQARLGLLLALGAAACTGREATGGPSDSSTDVTAPVGDASDDGACTSTVVVQASSFDQSCVSDLDCAAVAQGSVCVQCAFACPNAAINNGALAAYQAVAVYAGAPFTGFCGCPEIGPPCCHQGKCSLSCDDDITDIDACVSAGGACVPYSALLEGGLSCVRISYCAADPSMPGPTGSVCCPAPIADGGAGE